MRHVLVFLAFFVLAFSSPSAFGAAYPTRAAAMAACQATLPSDGYSTCEDHPDQGVVYVMRFGSAGQAFSYDEPANNCGAAVPLSDVAFAGQTGSSNPCSGGCAYAPSNAGKISVEMGPSNSIFKAANEWKPTGESCQVMPEPVKQPFDPNKETCNANGSFMECVKPDGTHCISSTDSAGLTRNLCWMPFETGKKITKDGKLAADREQAPGIPTAPPNQTDSTLIHDSSTTINGNQYNTSTFSGSGNSGGQGNTGTGNDNGEGGTGSGDQGGDEGDGDGPGAPSGDVGTLYEDPNLTAAGIAGEFFTKVMDTPIAGQIRTFMTVPSGGAGCPTFVLPASSFWESMTLEMHCSGAILAALQAAGYLCLAIATYVGARIAFT